MGQLYEYQDEPLEAAQACLRSETIYDVFLKEKAIDDISPVYTAVALLEIKTRDLLMAKLYTQKYIVIFVADHTRTLEILEKPNQRGMPVVE